MQTIKITVTSSTPTNIVVKECKTKEKDVTGKLGELLKELTLKHEVLKDEQRSNSISN